MAAPEPPAGTVSPELEACQEAKDKVRDKNLACSEVAGKMFVLYENLLRENDRHKWTTIVESQVNAPIWTDLKGTVHTVPRSPSYQSFEDCVNSICCLSSPSTQQNRKGIISMCILKSLLVF